LLENRRWIVGDVECNACMISFDFWQTLSEEERAPYVAMACEDYDRYEAEMIEYDPNFTTNVNKRKRSLKDKDPNLPKRPISAFFIFSAAKRQELKDANPDWKYSTVAQELGRIWNNLSEDEKKPYQDQGKAAKEEYNAVSVCFILMHILQYYSA